MSSALPPKPRLLGGRARIAIVASKFNEQFSDALVDHAVEEIGEIMPATRIDIIRVPGAFEIPVAVAAILAREGASCVIALGCIIRGTTSHADLVGRSVTDSLQQLAVQHQTPVIHEVLLVDDEKQAYARCLGVKLNRGREAARAATAMIEVFYELNRTMPSDSASGTGTR
jgi:6,7-dimethyl-8-ribityllumazine synthase